MYVMLGVTLVGSADRDYCPTSLDMQPTLAYYVVLEVHQAVPLPRLPPC